MHRITREEYPIDTLQRIVNGVTFFKELIQTDPSQFELLMSVTRFVTAEQDEIILHRGEDANVLYFLLKGQLAVMADDDSGEVINEINPGEMFGVMALVLNFKRSASIKVNGRSALLAGIDFHHFSDLERFHLIQPENQKSVSSACLPITSAGIWSAIKCSIPSIRWWHVCAPCHYSTAKKGRWKSCISCIIRPTNPPNYSVPGTKPEACPLAHQTVAEKTLGRLLRQA